MLEVLCKDSVIGKSDGKKTIANSGLFDDGVSSELKNHYFNKDSIPTTERKVSIYTLQSSGNIDDAIEELSRKSEKTPLTQSQIVMFAEKYINWLGANQSVFFLCKHDGELVVIVIECNKGEFNVRVVHSNEFKIPISKREDAPCYFAT